MNKKPDLCLMCHGSGMHPLGSTHCPLCLGLGVEIKPRETA